ncbi:hypothetical protein H2198_006106 [Neophaeococcomyces mojaviensis]|uniref:Uncharacterized protein n=1 Tax=Neophaeococcomyces mojaviensis TaxID=3383035 RepID=A0ACC3A457_9EURO|nr:hypothetical protein H2198_006106 [Knufia sp. JES_112]
MSTNTNTNTPAHNTTTTSHHDTNPSSTTGTSNIKQSHSVQESSTGASRINTDGNIVTSSDPSVHPDASIAQKLKGDVQGAVKGTVGSLQGATGAMLRNKGMEEKGLEKMHQEDERLGAKAGVMPVGSGTRETTEKAI